MYNEFKETVKQPALLASIIGFFNPVTIIPIIAIGALVHWGLYIAIIKGQKIPKI